MNILLLCEGDAETHAAFSGSAKSIVDHLRRAGDTVVTADCDLRGIPRYLAAAVTFSADRHRWAARYHLADAAASFRTRRAKHNWDRLGTGIDAVLQFGATFVPPVSDVPYFIYCDSNIRMAQRGRDTGLSWASPLSDAELDEIANRERRVYDGAAAVFTISEYLRASFMTDFGLSPDRVVAAGAGPNMAVPPRPEHRVRDTSEPVVLFVGIDFERKGGDLLLLAFERVRERFPRARLLIVGPEPRTAAPGVEWLGFLRKSDPLQAAALDAAYASANVFCLPTRYEPFGIAYIEAMLHGVPCIGPDAWAVPEMVVDGVNGFTFPPGDADALADRLLRILADPHEAARMGQRGREHAEQRFSWEKSVDRMRDVMIQEVARAR